MSTISKILFEKAREFIDDGVVIEDFVIGVGLTAVKLSDGRAGVAFTNKQDTLGRCEEFYRCMGLDGDPESKARVGMTALELLEVGLFSGDPLLRSVAYAALNAVFNFNRDRFVKGDVMEYLQVNENDIVGMVGEIEPLADAWKDKVWDLLIFDRNRKRDEIFPDWAIVDLLPKCTVVVITGSAIVNGSIDWVLKYVMTEKVAIVGPSTPLVEGVLPVKILAGVYIKDPDVLFDLVSKGAGTRKIIRSGAAEKVNIIQKSAGENFYRV